MNNIVLLGHGVGVKFVIESLLKSDLNYNVVALVTHPFSDHKYDLEMIENRKDLYGPYAYNVFNIEDDYKIELFESEDVNSEKTVRWIDKHYPKYIISIGCRNILKKKFLQHFKGKVFNIHTTPLPSYRGAASDSWMILNEEWGKEKYGCFHYIDTGIDTGDIVAKSYYTVPDKSYPIDVFKARMDTFHDIMIKGLSNLESKNFIPESQDMDSATVFPRLFTPRDGKINFERFSGVEIVRFIYAFGYPFQGAFCFLKEKKVNILNAEFYDDIKLHSFSLGLIFGKNEKNEYKVGVRDGYLLIKEIEIDGESMAQSKVFRLGRTLI